ncbi:MAG: hypothetical protein COB02_07950 [Candidatus Cloacimonadota bacterium]|nr:MAG: hypothetical protein COB02_07950 [Candidatus Cloacimonadota bacterium]
MDSLYLKKEQLISMLESFGLYNSTKFEIVIEGRVLRYFLKKKERLCIFQVPLQEDYTYETDLLICNILLNINKSYFTDEIKTLSLEDQIDSLNLVLAILEDLEFYDFYLNRAISKQKILENTYQRTIYFSREIDIVVSFNEIVIKPEGPSISPSKIYLCQSFSYSVLRDICSFVLKMSKQMQEDYDYLSKVSQWV